MKKLGTTIFTFLLVFNILIFNCYGEGLSVDLEDSLKELGIEDEYSRNIANYIENLKISDKSLDEIISNVEEISDTVSVEDKGKLDLSDYFQVYNTSIEIADILNLDLKVDIIDRDFKVIDRSTKNTLLVGDMNTLMEIYSKYIELGYDKEIQTFVGELYDEVVYNDEVDEYINNNEIVDNNNGDYNQSTDSALKLEQSSNYNGNNNVDSKENKDEIDKYIEEIKASNSENIATNSYDNWFFVLGGAMLFGLLGTIVWIILLR